MRILSIVGARPQFIKAAIVSRKIRDEGIKEILVHTGQHYDFNMSDIFFQELNLPKPDYHLGVGSGSHGEQTGKMLLEIEKVLLQQKPDVALVYGDTNTTLAGSLAAAKLHIPVAHIEAGLRSYNRSMPEEINRVLTDHCSDILFCPTETAVKNLQKEGFVNVVGDGKLVDDDFSLAQRARGLPLVINVGDVMLDIALDVKKLIEKKTDGEKRILERYFLRAKDYILVTIHRADNTDNKENLQNIMEALKEITRSGLKIFFPAHPRTKKALERFNLISDVPQNLIVSEPISYVEIIALESNAKLIITDSGGLQKEAYFFKVPCIIPRDETEWTELVEIGWNKVVGTAKENLVNAVLSTLNEDTPNRQRIDFYGNGSASEKIVKVLLSYKR
ncbi:MAG: UDP-N-acetylglucosamine 2-epimerase (non-hydrolyzing) [Desulfobacteraceae bacterium]|nr:UDP-N-acetylglucosamine 2-epimerase (non-hydrolyzing) [Desulfobacteraceae bacterium]